jgi:hypothetical protein
MANKIMKLSDCRVQTSDDTRTSEAPSNIGEDIIRHDTEMPITRYKHIGTEELYPLSQQMRPELANASLLLDKGLFHISEAIKHIQNDSMMESDGELMRFQSLLPELFCCRSIGDGFATMVVGVYHSLLNQKGDPLELGQLRELFKIVQRLRTEIYISVDEANDELIKLEDVGLTVDPCYISPLAAILGDESIR